MNPKDLKPGEVRWIDRNIYARGTRAGTRYGISFCHRGTRYRKIVGPTITEARRALAITRSRILQGRYQLAQETPSVPFDALARRYIEHAKTTKASWRHDEYSLRSMTAFFGSRPLSAVTSWSVEQYKAKRRQAVGPRSVNADLSLLRRMFNLAVTWGLAEKNPLVGVKMFRENERPLRVLSYPEQEKLMSVCRQHLGDLVLFALHTGMRRGEILGLKWDAVDLERGVITVEAGKTGRIRYVPANAIVMEVLRRRKELEREYVFTWGGTKQSRFDKTWRAAVSAAGIAAIRFHDLRHTFATRLVLAGVDLVTVGELLGHRSIQMTLRYSHPGPEHRRRAVDHLSEVAHICHRAKAKKPAKRP